MEIIAFRWMADYGHFSHPATTYTSLTYPLPPKTVVAGLLGAIIGEDDYWKLCNQFRYAVAFGFNYRTKKFSFNGVQKVLDSAMVKVDKKYVAQDTSTRKQFQRELICNPKYLIYLDLSEMSETFKSRIITYLKEHKAAYTPYMGINLCLCDFEWVEVQSVLKIEEENADVTTITRKDDFVFEIENGQRLTTAIMASRVDAQRHFGGFCEYIISLNPKSTIRTKNSGNIYAIDGQNHCFF
jgi:CRISPR-associated protein Cas5h